MTVRPPYWLLMSMLLGFSLFAAWPQALFPVVRPMPLRLCAVPVEFASGQVRCLSPTEATRWNVTAGDVVPLSPDGIRLVGPPQRMSGERQILLGLGLDPNVASLAELQALPDVGPALAEAIVVARQTARFRVVDDLLSVRGIGPKRLEKLRPYLRLVQSR